ncbi:uncharacterized protein TRIADDRAFT_50632 [Trichoplax adhaerens]|uniref:Acetyltransferase component of pyruvate dehydrogenase complex n=1 Tax=Trichoplax adhaerens TaxID=10228 RepID=B3S488_TRIAD|nr:hypothetical protein TRIADDRAFT_50632 [Trichoplax adhaerens]EDV22413.1 hypothetical protein TRIADDRAFT_50632 [Trichoplax adhaerens]|eukprot:XP_002114957.1 hypothetical protein TRIADDRAFT_50632 [Trichoplax adhaerens]
MQMGTLLSWEKAEGDELEDGDLLASIETDKATMDWETPEAGYLAKIVTPEGTKDIPVGKLVCIIVENKEDINAFKDFKDEGGEVTEAVSVSSETVHEPARSQEEKPMQQSVDTTSAKSALTPAGDRIFASPLARSIASEQGVDLASIAGSGPGGQIRKDDVLNFASTPTTTAAPPSEAQYVDIPISGVRKIIANRLSESKQTIPHYYLTVDINVDEILSLRKRFNDMANGNYKLSVNDFVVKAAALSMKEVPEVNSSWHDTYIRQYKGVDVSVAVDTGTGLITPIIFDAHNKGLSSISSDVTSLALRARENKLKPEEFQGGTFTISNLGMFGIKQFTAIINPPQACILAVGTTEKRMIPDNDVESGYSTATFMSVTLSCDHRIVDGATGARWLSVFRSLMEKPETMLL